MQELVRKVKYGGLFVIDEVVEWFVEFAGNNEIEAVYLLGHKGTKFFIKFTSFKIILL